MQTSSQEIASKATPDVKTIKLEEGWKSALSPEFSKTYMVNLREFLKNEIAKKKIIYPRPSEYFAAFNNTPLDNVKVVIIGQDPYHGPGQAHGLCFSVRPGVDVPPSLANIYKELKTDVQVKPPDHGCLISWAQQGVLLLNATLSVENAKAGAHQKKGWEEFTDAAIRYLNEHKDHLVFVLWGSYAQKKGEFIDTKKHLVIKSPHPSPLSSHRGFFGSQPFSKTNAYLKKHGEAPIDWSLPTRAEVEKVLKA